MPANGLKLEIVDAWYHVSRNGVVLLETEDLQEALDCFKSMAEA